MAASHKIGAIEEFSHVFEDGENSNERKTGFGPVRVRTNWDPKSQDLYKLYLEGATNLWQSLLHGASISGDLPFLGVREELPSKAKGKYIWQTYNQVVNRCINLASGLSTLGLVYGGNVAIFSGTRFEWTISEYSCYHQGYVPVPLYDTLGPESIEYCLNLTECTVVIASLAKVKQILDIKKKLPKLVHIVIMDDGPIAQSLLDATSKFKGLTMISMKDLEKVGSKSPLKANEKVNMDSIASICFTSGTTGNPKGAVFTHRSILLFIASTCHVLKSGDLSFGIPRKDGKGTANIFPAYMPQAHIFERVIEAQIIFMGCQIGFYGGDITKLVDDIQELKPYTFVTVPRLLNRVFEGVWQKVEASGSVKKFLFKLAYKQKIHNLRKTGTVTHWFWDRVVFKSVRMKLGGKMNMIISASAPLAENVRDFFKVAFSANFCEGYGSTESIGLGCQTSIKDKAILHGGVGPPATGMYIRLKDCPDLQYYSTDKPFPRGEICLKSDGILKEYFKDPERTKEAPTEDGWLLTGDVGLWDDAGHLVIIDRVKNIFKLSQGEYISPEKVENAFVASRYIQQCWVHGDSLQSSLVAVVVPNEGALVAIAEKIGLDHTQAVDVLAKDSQVRKEIVKELDVIGRHRGLHGFELVKSVYIELEPWTSDNLLSATMKMKRSDAKKRYIYQIEAMYKEILEAPPSGSSIKPLL